MNTTDVSRCKFGNTSISRNFLDIPEFPRFLGKFFKFQVDSQIPKILGKFPSSGSAVELGYYTNFIISAEYIIIYSILSALRKIKHPSKA